MPMWKNASAVFVGGMGQIRALYGRRVRAKAHLQGIDVYDPATPRRQAFSLAPGMVGFVARPHPTRFDLLLAFPNDPARLPARLEGLQPGLFKVVEVNEPTFRQQFEVEVP